jgi:hypothetical protein
MRHLMCSNLVQVPGFTSEDSALVAGHRTSSTTSKYYITKHGAKEKAHDGLLALHGEARTEPTNKREVKAQEKKKAAEEAKASEEEWKGPNPALTDEAAKEAGRILWKETRIGIQNCVPKKGRKVLYDIGAGDDAHELHRSFDKMGLFEKVVYLDIAPVAPPDRMKVNTLMETYWMDLVNALDEFENLMLDDRKVSPFIPVIFARWFFCHLTDPETEAVLKVAQRYGADLLVLDSTAKRSAKMKKLPGGMRFIERNHGHWLKLFSEDFEVKSFLLTEVKGVEQQTLYHLKAKPSK